MTTAAIDKVRAFFKDDAVTRKPFTAHPLAEETDFTKGLYVTMLAALVQYEHTPLREQLIFLERIVKGTKLELSTQQLLQKAKVIDTQFAKEFYEEFAGSSLAKNFIVDALILTNCHEHVYEQQLDFLVELVDVLGVTKDEFIELLTTAQQILVVLEEETERFYEDETFSRLNLLYYIASNENNVKRLFDVDATIFSSLETSYDKIYIYNSKFNLEEDTTIQANVTLHFINCTFNGVKPLQIETGCDVLFERCLFKGMGNRCLLINDAKALYLFDNRFENCGFTEYITSYGGVIYAGCKMEFYLLKNTFTNCSLRITDTYRSSYGAIIGAYEGAKNVVIVNNEFESCYATTNNDSGTKVLFYFKEYSEHQVYPKHLAKFSADLNGVEKMKENFEKYNQLTGHNSKAFN